MPHHVAEIRVGDSQLAFELDASVGPQPFGLSAITIGTPLWLTHGVHHPVESSWRPDQNACKLHAELDTRWTPRHRLMASVTYSRGFSVDDFLALARRVGPGEYSRESTAAALTRTISFGAWDA